MWDKFFNILASIDDNSTFFRIECIATPIELIVASDFFQFFRLK